MAKKLKEPKRTPVKRAAKPSRRQRRRREPQPNLTFESFLKMDRSAVLLSIFLYCLVHWTIRTIIEPVYTLEEGQQILLSQSLQLGYSAGQPPLLSWLYALAAKAGPLIQPTVFGIKYALMWLGLALYYLSARNVLVRPGMSAAALGALAVVFQVGWGMHEDLLGAVILMAALSATLHAVTRILTWRRQRDWIYLGVAVGLGLLSHHLYFLFPLSLFAAIYVTGFFRDGFPIPRLIFALAIALAIYAPYVFWIVTHGGQVAGAFTDLADSWAVDGDIIARLQKSGGAFLATLIAFTLPFSFFWAALFWPLWLPMLYPMLGRRSTDEEQHEAAWRSLFLRATGMAAAVCLIGVVLGVELWKGYWMLPVLFTAPLWLFSHVKRGGDFPVAIRAFAGIVVVFIVLVIGGRFVEWRLDINSCQEGGCDTYAPVKAWAAELEKAGFAGGTIVGADPHLTGNLLTQLPKARVLDAKYAVAAYPAPYVRGACVVVWRDTPAMPQDLSAYLEQKLGVHPYDHGAEGAIRRPLLLSRTKAATLYFQFAPPSELCR